MQNDFILRTIARRIILLHRRKLSLRRDGISPSVLFSANIRARSNLSSNEFDIRFPWR